MWQLTRQQISNERLQLFHLLNKDIFYLFKSQLTNIEQPSWKNPTEEMTLSNFCYFSLAMVYPRRYNRMDLDLTTFLITYQRRKESEANWCHSVKPWSNGVASRRKLKTRGLLATPFCQGKRVLVRKLASPFGHTTQVSTQVQLAASCRSVWPGLKTSLRLIRSVITLVINKPEDVFSTTPYCFCLEKYC